MERTFFMLKPDLVEQGVLAVDDVLLRISKAGLNLAVFQKIPQLPRSTAEVLYAQHASRPFYNDLINYITSGPIVVGVADGENAVSLWRDILGATDPQKAEPGTIRALYGKSLDANAAHGSDSVESAEREIAIFFPALRTVS